MEIECQHVASTVRNVIALTEAFQMEQATKLHSGPFAGFRQRVLSTRGATDQSPIRVAKDPPDDPGAPGSLMSPADSTSIDGKEPGPWARKTLLTLGMQNPTRPRLTWLTRSVRRRRHQKLFKFIDYQSSHDGDCSIGAAI